MNEDKLLSSTLSTSPLLFWAVNETETMWERKQTHNQSQEKGIKERRVHNSLAQAGNGAKWRRQWDGKWRDPVTSLCPKEKALSAERGWVVGQCCHFLGWADPEHSSWPTKISHIPFACNLFAMLSPLAQHSACCPERKVWVKNLFWGTCGELCTFSCK